MYLQIVCNGIITLLAPFIKFIMSLFAPIIKKLISLFAHLRIKYQILIAPLHTSHHQLYKISKINRKRANHPEGHKEMAHQGGIIILDLVTHHPVQLLIYVLFSNMSKTSNRNDQTSASFICASLPVSLLSSSSFANSVLHSRIAPWAVFSKPRKLIPPYHKVLLSMTAYR